MTRRPATKWLQQFMDLAPGIKAQRIRAVLETAQGFSSKYMPRVEYAEQNFRTLRVDYNKGRIYTSETIFFNIKDTTRILADYVLFLQRINKSPNTKAQLQNMRNRLGTSWLIKFKL